ncbi:hypothetical protein BASA50_001818 [Batrachochytrium salamandrivorans]|uniref:triacylglycerol lipase n=1 Tax=Batrachochytrium salamandrivorans TaxID=1357716 RepID=A0ABQ8FN41_9FUNG|nr:hypothetical protein BASA62_009076 [Batrachochytrium salamandrivorans]KAH6583158.1 hypothetical protein BASA61_008128 [Batrachochytrium salamandrivorans]KAH6583168.1 hypothetical protein BASA61_008138 [Batrachochytrium salamandrivorans]KAH6585095.1 hypothetical protein BASA60_000690 [Batrachochytrium salamandrivorans]KAH6601140.1 hypothetical protein BASA50_001818 [Batrachochytrium salamandrivorans]
MTITKLLISRHTTSVLLLALALVLALFPSGGLTLAAFPSTPIATQANAQAPPPPPPPNTVRSLGNIRLATVLHATVSSNGEPMLLANSLADNASTAFMSRAALAGGFKLSEFSTIKEWSLLSRRNSQSPKNCIGCKDARSTQTTPLMVQYQDTMQGESKFVLPKSPRVKTMLLPDHTDPTTVLNFARLTYNSYYEPDDKAWLPVPGWNVTGSFGWNTGGIRGYVFSDDTEDTLIIVIKGTSLATPVGSGPTAKLDKLNDNMMFSCCCAKGGWEWTPICNCPISTTECSNSCLLKESSFDDSYFNLAQTIFLTVKEWFPRHTNIWMTGHSLGGALAALVALTNDLPSFSFESPGDLLFASRLGLLPDLPDPTPFLKSVPIYHFGNDADPIFLGLCTGVTSSCYWMDYALETKCHIGKECIYPSNTFTDAPTSPVSLNPDIASHSDGPDELLYTKLSVRYHSIDFVIKQFLETSTKVPKCTINPKCLSTECPTWKFVD